MSNNVMQFPNAKRMTRRKIFLYALLVIGVFIALLMTVLWEPMDFDRSLRILRYGSKEHTVTFDAHASNVFTMCGDSLLVSAAGGAKLCPVNGTDAVFEATSFASPAINSGKRYALSWDIGAHQLLFADGARKMLTKQSIAGDILDADISDSGIYCVASAEGGYKTVLRLFGKDGQERFRWFSASQFLPLCACSSNGQHLAAVSYGIKDGSFRSELQLFRSDQDQISKTVSLSNAIVYDLRYIGNNTLCVVSEDAVRCFSPNGELRGEWIFESDLVDYDLSSDRFVLLAFDAASSTESTTLVTLDYAAKVLGQTTVGGKCRSVSSNGRFASLLTEQAFLLYRSDLTPYARFSEAAEAQDAFVRSDGSAILIGDRKAELALPR